MRTGAGRSMLTRVVTVGRTGSLPSGGSEAPSRSTRRRGGQRLHRAILLDLDDFDVGRIGGGGLQQPGAVEPPAIDPAADRDEPGRNVRRQRIGRDEHPTNQAAAHGKGGRQWHSWAKGKPDAGLAGAPIGVLEQNDLAQVAPRDSGQLLVALSKRPGWEPEGDPLVVDPQGDAAKAAEPKIYP